MDSKTQALVFALLFFLLFLIASFGIGLFSSADSLVFSFFSYPHSDFAINIAKAAGFAFEPAAVIAISLIACFFLCLKGLKKESFIFAALMLASGGSLYAIKEIVLRARPLGSLVYESSSSFPSGHAMIAVVFLGFLAFLLARRASLKQQKIVIYILAAFLAVLIGMSRLYLGVHWLSDVVAGFLIGLAMLFLGIYIYKRR